MTLNKNVGVKTELKQDISLRVVQHRNRFRKLIYNRYLEFLPLLISYTNSDKTGIDFVQLEHGLRQGYQVVVGKARNGEIMILGYIQNDLTYAANATSLFDFRFNHQRRLTQDDITFIIPKYLRPERCMEIQKYDNCKSGDFVVIRNKPYTLNNDFEIIEHYCDELAEIALSRFSLIMQSKFAKVFKSEINDETINQFITELYNGTPFIKVSKTFDADEDEIIDLGSEFVVSSLTQMKREYQNKISELNNFLGINSLGVDKESGVSDQEAKSNDGFTSANSNIYLKGREPIRMLSKRFDIEMIPYYNNEVLSELSIKHHGRDKDE